MSRAPAKAKASTPAKVDPTAPAPTPEDALVRAKASRPTFRRAGLVFNDRDWTSIDPEIGDEASLAILAEPVLTVQVRVSAGEWRTLSTDDRAAAIAEARPSAADEIGKP